MHSNVQWDNFEWVLKLVKDVQVKDQLPKQCSVRRSLFTLHLVSGKVLAFLLKCSILRSAKLVKKLRVIKMWITSLSYEKTSFAKQWLLCHWKFALHVIHFCRYAYFCLNKQILNIQWPLHKWKIDLKSLHNMFFKENPPLRITSGCFRTISQPIWEKKKPRLAL